MKHKKWVIGATVLAAILATAWWLLREDHRDLPFDQRVQRWIDTGATEDIVLRDLNKELSSSNPAIRDRGVHLLAEMTALGVVSQEKGVENALQAYEAAPTIKGRLPNQSFCYANNTAACAELTKRSLPMAKNDAERQGILFHVNSIYFPPDVAAEIVLEELRRGGAARYGERDVSPTVGARLHEIMRWSLREHPEYADAYREELNTWPEARRRNTLLWSIDAVTRQSESADPQNMERDQNVIDTPTAIRE
jgi:hypothetical protein